MSEQPPPLSLLRERQAERQKSRDTFDQIDNISLNALWIARNQQIRMSVWNSDSNVSLIIAIARMLYPNGDVVDVPMQISPTSDRAVTAANFEVGQGWLIEAFAFASGTTPDRGQTYIVMDVLNTKFSLATSVVMSGYITGESVPSFPFGIQEGAQSGKGKIRAITGTNPAAGAEISETVPTNALWKLKAMIFSLTTDANVTDRSVALLIGDGTNTIHDFVAQTVQTASTTIRYQVTHFGYQPTAIFSEIYIPTVDELFLPAGFTIDTFLVSGQAGDNFTAPQMLVEEWIQE